MTTALSRRLLAIVAVVATGLVLAACGSDNATGPSDAQVSDAAATTAPAATTTTTAPATTTTTAPATTTTTTTASADGKAVFTENCAGCHTLAAADATGQVGPNLDDLKPDDGTVVHQVENGGGSMPAFKDQLSDDEIKAVAAFVSSNAGG